MKLTQSNLNSWTENTAIRMMEEAGIVRTPENVKSLAIGLQAICHEEWRHMTEANVMSAGNILTARIGGTKNLDGYLRCVMISPQGTILGDWYTV